MIGRMNDKFDAEIVPTGKYKVGDILENQQEGLAAPSRRRLQP